MSLTLQVFMTLLLAAYAHAQKSECFDAMDCTTNEFQTAISKNDKRTLCRLGPGVVACVERLNNECDDKDMKATNKKQADLLMRTLTESCGNIIGTTTVSAPVRACLTVFAACQSDQFEEFLRKKDEESVCRVGAGVVECLENAESQCKHDDTKTQNRNLVTKFKESLKNCRKTGQTTRRPTTGVIAKCTSDFTDCLPPELSESSNQQEYEKICRLVNGAISCMENALAHCNKEQDKPEVKKLHRELNKMKSNLSTSKCACKNDDFSDCNEGNFGGISILYTLFALILAVFLH